MDVILFFWSSPESAFITGKDQVWGLKEPTVMTHRAFVLTEENTM